MRFRGAVVLVGAMLVTLTSMAPAASAAPTRVSGCRTLSAPGAYALSGDIAAVDATCITITASDVQLDLAGHTITCTGSGFLGSCQVPATGATGVVAASNLTGVAVTGPGSIVGFDSGVAIFDSNALVKDLTVTGPACAPADCSRPVSNGIAALGESGVNLSRNDVSNHAAGLRLLGIDCPGGGTECVLNGNTVHDNNGADLCLGINLGPASGYRLTRNVVYSNGSTPCFPRGGITLNNGSTGNTVTNNDSSNNNGFGISAGPATNGNTFVNNTARGNALVDLSAFPGTSNSWNDNNRCNTESGAVPSSVCNPGE